MRRVFLAIIGFSAAVFLSSSQEVFAARAGSLTVCTHQFLTLPSPTSDPFGYRYTESLTIPGIGNQRRIAQCQYIGGGGDEGGGGGGIGGIGGGGGVGLRRPRINYTAYIADLLRTRRGGSRPGTVALRGKGGVGDKQDGAPPIDALDPDNDSDCDGFTNFEERFLGTDPLDPEDPVVSVRKRTVSLNPRHPCYAGAGNVAMPKTGWDRGEWFFPEQLPQMHSSSSFPWILFIAAIACASFALSLSCRGHAAISGDAGDLHGPRGRGR